MDKRKQQQTKYEVLAEIKRAMEKIPIAERCHDWGSYYWRIDDEMNALYSELNLIEADFFHVPNDII